MTLDSTQFLVQNFWLKPKEVNVSEEAPGDMTETDTDSTSYCGGVLVLNGRDSVTGETVTVAAGTTTVSQH
jgi:hypothetical protein